MWKKDCFFGTLKGFQIKLLYWSSKTPDYLVPMVILNQKECSGAAGMLFSSTPFFWAGCDGFSCNDVIWMVQKPSLSAHLSQSIAWCGLLAFYPPVVCVGWGGEGSITMFQQKSSHEEKRLWPKILLVSFQDFNSFSCSWCGLEKVTDPPQPHLQNRLESGGDTLCLWHAMQSFLLGGVSGERRQPFSSEDLYPSLCLELCLTCSSLYLSPLKGIWQR